MILVIMAAGMGSRYGGLKQIDPVGPNGEFIIDYSVYDAIKVGFKKIVFIIKHENYEIFKETIGKRIEKVINVEYVFQEIPYYLEIPESRVKPLGTAHAIYSCKDVIDDKFAVINADDFYGFDAFKKIYDYLNNMNDNEACLVGYQVKNTLTENGAVKRGVCYCKNGYLDIIKECSIEVINNKIVASPLNGDMEFEVDDDTLVSMNMLGFNKSIFKHMEEEFKNFLENNKNKLDVAEWFIPDVLFNGVKSGNLNVRVLETSARWYGVTFKEDKIKVVTEINKMIDSKEYPNNLWN